MLLMMVGCMVVGGRLVGGLVGWLFGWVVGGLVGWSVAGVSLYIEKKCVNAINHQ